MKPEAETAAAQVQRGDPDRFAATMAAPPALRPALFTLYALNLEIARAPWASREPLIAEMRLTFWDDALAGLSQGLVPQHELGPALASHLAPHAEGLRRIVSARRLDIAGERLTEAGFTGYLSDTSGALLSTAARLCGAGAGAETMLAKAGWAQGMANYLLALPRLEAEGRSLFPEASAASVRRHAKRACGALREAYAGRADLTKGARPALLVLWRTKGLLERVIDAPDRALNGTLAEPEILRRWGLLRCALTGRWA